MTDFLKLRKGRIIIIAAAVIVLIAVILVIFLPSAAGGGIGCRNISVSKIFGSVMAENNGNEYKAYESMRLADGYALTTDIESYSRLSIDDDKYMKLEQESRAEFRNVGNANSHETSIYLARGALTAEIVNPLTEDESFFVNTPNAVIAVRGTFYRVEVSFDKDGDAFTDVYAYGGAVDCHRIMPDGTEVEEEVVINQGYKARIKMDEIITVYVEEEIEDNFGDDVDPIDVSKISNGDIVDIYNASYHGHAMFLTTRELWQEILDRDIDIEEYYSPYDMGEIPVYNEVEETTTEAETTYETTTTAEVTTEATTTFTETEMEYATPAPETMGSLPQSETSVTLEPDGNAGADTAVTVLTTVPEVTSQPAVTSSAAADQTTEGVSGSSAVSQVSSGAAGTFVPDSSTTETVPETTSTTEETTAESSTTVTVPETTSTPEETTTESSTSVTVPEEISTPEETTAESSTSVTVTEESSTPEESTTENSTSVTVPEEISTPEESTTENSTSVTVPEESSSSSEETTSDTGSSTTEPEPEVTSSTEETAEPEPEPVVPDGILYTEDGSIVITETGYTQGESGSETPYTGDYLIRQRDPETAVSGFALTVESGAHVITLGGINVSEESYPINIAEAANVVMLGGAADNTVSASLSFSYAVQNSGTLTLAAMQNAVIDGIHNGGSLTIDNGSNLTINRPVANISGGSLYIKEGSSVNINADGFSAAINNASGCSVTIGGGAVYAEGMMYGVLNYGDFAVSGGSVTASGTGSCDISTDEPITVTGGSLRLVNSLVDGAICNEYGDELECVVYEVFPTEAERTFVSAAGESYVYGLREGDCAEDGLYYVWRPVQDKGIAVDEENFPDPVFLEYVRENFDIDNDGYLSEREIESTTDIDVSGYEITSLMGLEYFTALTYLDCSSCNLPYVDISNNPSITLCNAYDNTYPIPSNAIIYDTTTDPNFEGFKSENVSEVENATFSDGVFTNISDDVIYYTYNCGQGKSVTFTLVRTSTYSLSTPLFTTPTEDQNSVGELDISDPSESLIPDAGETVPDTDGLANAIEDAGGNQPDSGDVPVEEVLALARGRPP